MSLSAAHKRDVMPDENANSSDTESQAKISGSFSLRMEIATRSNVFFVNISVRKEWTHIVTSEEEYIPNAEQRLLSSADSACFKEADTLRREDNR